MPANTQTNTESTQKSTPREESTQKSGLKTTQKTKENPIIEPIAESIVEKLGEKLGKKLGKKLGENRLGIIKLIVSNPNITYVEISRALSVSSTTVEKRIAEMSGVIIKHVGPKKGGHWEIIE